MPKLLLNDKEAAAMIVILENFIADFPFSHSAKIIRDVPGRIRNCLALQGKKNRQGKNSLDGNGKPTR